MCQLSILLSSSGKRNRETAAIGRVSRQPRMKREMRLDLLVLEMTVEKFVDGLMPQVHAQELALLLDPPRHQRLGDLLHRDRRRIHQRAQNQIAIAARFLVDGAERIGILAREARDRCAGLVEIGMHHQRGAVVEHARHLHRRLHVAQSMAAGQLEIVIDRADPDQRVIIRMNVVQETRPGQLLGAQAAAFFGALLENADAPSRLREIGGERQPVVT